MVPGEVGGLPGALRREGGERYRPQSLWNEGISWPDAPKPTTSAKETPQVCMALHGSQGTFPCSNSITPATH